MDKILFWKNSDRSIDFREGVWKRSKNRDASAAAKYAANKHHINATGHQQYQDNDSEDVEIGPPSVIETSTNNDVWSKEVALFIYDYFRTRGSLDRIALRELHDRNNLGPLAGHISCNIVPRVRAALQQEFDLQRASQIQQINSLSQQLAVAKSSEQSRIAQKTQDDSVIRQLNGEVSRARNDIISKDRLISTLRAEKADEAAIHQANVQSLQEGHSTAVARLKRDHTTTTDRLTREHATAVEHLRADFATREQSLKQTLHETVKEAESNAKQADALHIRNVEDLTQKHKKASQRLYVQIQELNAALEQRDDEAYNGKALTTAGLPSRPDDKLGEAFSALQNTFLAELGGLQWKQEQTIWTDQILWELSGQSGPRLLRKAIIQDVIWTLLHYHVFASPFRVFGEEGQALEKEWSEHCSQVPSNDAMTWPEPSLHAERWRYLTIHSCYQALKEQVSTWDPRARVKRGYKDKIALLIQEMEVALGEMVEITQSVRKQIQELCKQSAKVWLDFQMHRCRIMIQLMGTGSLLPSERMAAIRHRPVSLTISPRLGRHGNTRGLDLETFTVIDRRGGESFNIG